MNEIIKCFCFYFVFPHHLPAFFFNNLSFLLPAQWPITSVTFKDILKIKLSHFSEKSGFFQYRRFLSDLILHQITPRLSKFVIKTTTTTTTIIIIMMMMMMIKMVIVIVLVIFYDRVITIIHTFQGQNITILKRGSTV